jgi:hypothetical protein
MQKFWSQKKTQKKVEEIQTDKQWYEQGEGRDGNLIGQYSAFTKSKKQREGVEYRHVTLRDTGDLYKSLSQIPKPFGLSLTVNTIKEGEDILLKHDYNKEILGLNDDNQELFNQTVAQPFLLAETEKMLRFGL